MRYVIVGCGNIGMELARRWVTAGHEVLGTTTSTERVPQLKEVCTDVAVLRGTEAEKVKDAVAGASAVVVAVSPRLVTTMDRRARAAEFRDTLVGTARTVVGVHRRVVLLSSTLVYGDGAEGGDVVDEETRRTIDLEPSAQGYATAERVVMEVPTGAVLRLPFVYNQPGAMDPTVLIHHLHGTALAYGIDYRDAAAAAGFVVANELMGLYNVVPDDTVPPTYEELLTPRVTFRNEMKTPTRPISSAKLRAAGFSFSYANPSSR